MIAGSLNQVLKKKKVINDSRLLHCHPGIKDEKERELKNKQTKLYDICGLNVQGAKEREFCCVFFSFIFLSQTVCSEQRCD